MDELNARPDSGSRPATSRMRWRPDASSLLAALMALPGFLASLLVMFLLGEALLPRVPWVVPVLWMLSGAAIFAAPVESAISRLVLDLRRPTAAELRILASPWRAVCRAAGVDGARYVLLVEDVNELNASASGGRTVAVTRSALRLQPSHLEAVLAHELGHHLAGHTAVSALAWWYALPARAAAYLIGLAVRFVVFVGRIFAAFGNGIGALVSLMTALMLLLMLTLFSFWLILVPLTAPLLAWASRLGEFRADRTAATLGYGPVLIEALHLMTAGHSRPTGLRARMLATHPSHGARISRIERAT
jgi:Zn-dependent protease with chaperone function